MKNQNLVDVIHLGVRRAYFLNAQFRDKWYSFETEMTEYIIVVKIAECIMESKELNNFNLIELEYPLTDFYKNAFPAAIWTPVLFNSKYIQRHFITEETTERMDIALLSQTSSDLMHNILSIHGIEVKSINTDWKGIIKDLRRLSKSMVVLQDRTGKSSIESCYSTFIRSLPSPTLISKHEKISNWKDSILKNVEDKLNKHFRFKAKYMNLEYNVSIEDIESTSYMELYDKNKNIPDFDMTWDPKGETGVVCSVVIEISQK